MPNAITARLWEEVKRRERGYLDPSPPLTVSLYLRPGADHQALHRELAALGAEVKPRGKGSGRWVVRVDPRHLPALACSPWVAGVKPVSARGRPVNLHRLAWGLAGLAVVGLAATLWWWGWPSPSQAPVVPTRATVRSRSAADLYQAGLAAYRRGDREDALRLWQELLRRRPERIGVRRSLAWLLYELGRREEAAEQFRAILARRPEDPEVREALALIQGRESRREHKYGSSYIRTPPPNQKERRP